MGKLPEPGVSKDSRCELVWPMMSIVGNRIGMARTH